MVEYFKTHYQIIGICAAAAAVLAVRIITTVRRESAAKAHDRRVQVWKRTAARCRGEGSFVLTDGEISRFSSDAMLRAFGELGECGEAEALSAILRENSGKIVARVGARADSVEKGYFAYLLSAADLAGLDKEARAEYAGFARKLLGSESVYCRENALKALYNLGDAQAVAAAVETLSSDVRLHNEKLLADGMNSFRGDRKLLAKALMERFDRYDDHSQSAVISFFTAAGFHGWDGEFKKRLQRDDISVDQRCDILRLIMKVPSWTTRPLLISILRDKAMAEDWQTAAVAATGLAAYKGDAETIDALRYGITSPAWDVRINCAFSLVRLDPPREVLDGILGGSDAFAADALRFAMSSKGTENE